MTADDLTPAEHALYLAALSNGGHLAAPPAAGPGADSGADSAALAGLLARGLFAPGAAGYAAVDPRAAGDRLAAGLRGEATRLLVRAENLPDALAPLTAAYDAAHQGPESHHVEGRDAIRHRISQLLAECQEELLTAQPGPHWAVTLEPALSQDLPLLMTGRRMRTIYQPAARRRPAVVEYAGAVTRHGSRIRLLDEPFDRTIIVDRSTAVVSARSDHGAAAFITDRATVAALVAVFERDWSRAAAVDWSATPHRAATRITGLLARGLTQGAIATRLGLSERTVAAHIARLRDRHGAQTLFQLGWRMRGEGDG
ncbi:LuxR C-terminal-related transcriptional regulator [Kitasatospora putterlickiae]|uniref:LuxR C-terminal-related transcriptional regulator n=1 Tax=Kitasatospora putterlickiae TaxID=221725 RepID=UPI0031DE97B8